jgi:hypothetical protein
MCYGTNLPHNGFELSGRGMPDRYLFYPPTSYNFAMKSRSIPGPFQRKVIRQDSMRKMLYILILTPQENNEILLWSINTELPI